jgi:uncharacterized sulfatase
MKINILTKFSCCFFLFYFIVFQHFIFLRNISFITFERKTMNNLYQYIMLGTLTGGMISSCATKQEKQTDKSKENLDAPNIIIAISDDQSWLHTSNAGCKLVNTPAYDSVAKWGVVFENAYCAAPSCAPSRASLLTGKYAFEMGPAANLWGTFPEDEISMVDILKQAGYYTGSTGKGYGPGKFPGREHNPAGEDFSDIRTRPYPEFEELHMWDIDYAANFKKFIKNKPAGKPFYFWYGGFEPHRSYQEGLGRYEGKKIEDVEVPPFWPDDSSVRDDMLNYLAEIEWFDMHLNRMINTLKEEGLFDNTIIIVTSDNGMPFPRAKATLYEYGTRMPLHISYGKKLKGNRKVLDFISHVDILPTLLEALDMETPVKLSGKSFWDILKSDKEGIIDSSRNTVFTFRERHTWCQPEGLSYPMRAVRQDKYVLIQNIRPYLSPAGHPDIIYSRKINPYGDIDGSPTKEVILNKPENEYYKQLAAGKRGEFELYNLEKDPYQLDNLANDPAYADVKNALQDTLTNFLASHEDPRIAGNGLIFDTATYYFSNGIYSAFMKWNEWHESSSEEKKAAMKKAKDLLREKHLEYYESLK